MEFWIWCVQRHYYDVIYKTYDTWHVMKYMLISFDLVTFFLFLGCPSLSQVCWYFGFLVSTVILNNKEVESLVLGDSMRIKCHPASHKLLDMFSHKRSVLIKFWTFFAQEQWYYIMLAMFLSIFLIFCILCSHFEIFV